MATIKLKGKVFDGMVRKMGGGYEGLPSPKVYISDSKGNVTKSKIRVLGDVDGNFVLSIPAMKIQLPSVGIPMPPAIVPKVDGKYITAEIVGFPKKTLPLGKTNTYDFNLGIKKGTQDVGEVYVKTDSDRINCIRAKGKWDNATRTCSLPKKHPSKKRMSMTVKILIGLGILVVVGGTVYLATRKKGTGK